MGQLDYQRKPVTSTNALLQAKGAATLTDRRSTVTATVLTDHRRLGFNSTVAPADHVAQRMPTRVAAAPAWPRYLYHAAPKDIAQLIAAGGLTPRSKGDADDDTLFLCMASNINDALTLKHKASDIIFRVDTSRLTVAHWQKKGAVTEWRGTDPIPATDLECRRYMGTNAQKAWRSPAAPNGIF